MAGYAGPVQNPYTELAQAAYVGSIHYPYTELEQAASPRRPAQTLSYRGLQKNCCAGGQCLAMRAI